ncbi:FecR domain-containing protein [Larkinella sp. VNQ87]|uniref:FecR domain-containing protein n=1 Tax=Larkinella sp. VNQ87 TaxID=3400921 RepID=UPI003C0F268D
MPDQPENRIDDDLLGKYLAGETDAAESERVRRWLAQDNSERQEFERFERIWNTAGALKQKPNPEQNPVDTDAAWAKMRTKMRSSAVETDVLAPKLEPVAPAPEPVIKPLPVDPPHTGRVVHWWQSPVWAVAAMAVLLSGLLWFFLNPNQPEPVEQLAAVTTNQKMEKILPDGTKVLLNQNSRLTYPEAFAADSREVELSGEAFFDVKPDPTKPFRIHVRNTVVQVLGTSFSIRAYTNDVRVAVSSGKVKFSSGKKAVTLVKNEQASFNAVKDTIITMPKLSADALTFKTGLLVFDKEPLSSVVKKLAEVYHADIYLANEQIAGCPFTSDFKENLNLEEVLTVTAESLKLQWRKDGNRFVLDGKPSCQ